MAVDVVEELLAHIEQLTAWDIQRLAEVRGVDWLSGLRTLQPVVAVQEIRRLLVESPSIPVLRDRVGWLYCWLMSRQKIGPWLLFRFGVSALQVDSNTLLLNVARTMQSVRRPYAIGVRQDRGTYYGCLISDDVDPNPRKWEVVFVVLWSGQRFAAAYAGTNDQQQALLTSLHIALSGESVELVQGIHADLNAAFGAGCQEVGRPTLFRLDKDPAIAARFFPNGLPATASGKTSSDRGKEG
ncbi:hypothetical protein MTO96_033760 [Rhipicephalus appendiculatus]